MGTVTLPVTLTANTNENVNDLNSNLNALASAINGNIDETNVPNLAAAFTSYKRIARACAQVTNIVGTFALNLGAGVAANVSNPSVGAANAAVTDTVLYLDPALYNANSRTTKLILRFFIVNNSTAPAVNYTAGLYPVATYGGGAGQGPWVNTVGTVIAGSTAVINAPGASVLATAVSTDFNFPAIGAYMLGVVPSGAAAANAVPHLVVQLEMRQV